MVQLFEKLCEEKFRFLVERFDCMRLPTEEEWDFRTVLYQNRTTAVKVIYEKRDGAVWVQVMRLLGGDRPEPPDDRRHVHGLWSVLKLRSESGSIDALARRVATVEDMAEVVSANASALETYAADILQGDFRVFPELTRLEYEAAEDWGRERARRSQSQDI